jgi:DNA-binding winged helix-turn-helix (wHTH) protein/Tfp pilus assembly protein PilF
MNKIGENLFEFGLFTLDVSERRLLKNGRPVHLQPKAFETLLVLVANCGHLVTKEQLIGAVWADAFVEENNLTKNIYTLRKALNDGSGEYIETIPRVGYRFNADVGENMVIERQSRSRLLIKETVHETTSGSPVLSGRYGRLAVVLMIIAGLMAVAFVIVQIRQRVQASALATAAAREQARELFTRGRALWQTRDARDLHEATVLLERSIALDPGSALAHSALADAYAFDYVNWKKVEAEANEAVRIDPSLGEPHAAIGFVRMFWEWRFAAAEAEYKRAIDLSPNYAPAHQWYAMNFAVSARKNAALAEIDQALTLEPASVSINSDRCLILYFMHRYEDATAQCKKALEINAGFLNAHANLFDIYAAQGSYNDAVDEFFAIERLHGTAANTDGTREETDLRRVYADQGITGFWRTLAEKYSQPPQNYSSARYHARLGDREIAVSLLRRAFEEHDPGMVLVAADPLFDNYHIGSNELDFWDQVLAAQL